MTIVLIGGGWDEAVVAELYRPFLAAAGSHPRIACVVLDEGDGLEQFERWRSVLVASASCEPVPVLVPLGELFDPRLLDGADGLLVCGGLTPAYAAALGPKADAVRAWLVNGNRPYAGFSAGAAIAAGRAVVGGYRVSGRIVCPDDAGEDLDEVSVVDGLGLVDAAIDVHCAQWGTLGRLTSAVGAGVIDHAFGIDENTALIIDRDGSRVVGAGNVHAVARTADAVRVISTHSGTGADVPIRALSGS